MPWEETFVMDEKVKTDCRLSKKRILNNGSEPVLLSEPEDYL